MGRSDQRLAILEIFLLVISLFSFSYFLDFNLGIEKNPLDKPFEYLFEPLIPVVSASEFVPSGCCLEAKNGAICQDMLNVDADLCETGLIGTSCEYVNQCQTGCCYNSEEGVCSLNAPQGSCEDTGGIWSNSPTCEIQECQVGCCIFGDSASVTTTRECTLQARELGFEKDFRSLDSSGTCSEYVGLSRKGACLTDSGDFSGENECVFTSKGNCNGDFHEGLLCTAEELNTVCIPSEKTSCIEGKDEVYFLDSCGNPANIYDASRVSDQNYWEKIISSSGSCDPASTNCGNCDYISGSFCNEYRPGKDPRPTYGDNVCRDLSCENGREHGESWCIYDSNPDVSASAPVGSRSFRGTCVEGEITIEGCADFNQEVCVENSDPDTGYTQSKCLVNEWRSCTAANEKETYFQVKRECERYDHCTMFVDIPGNENYVGLPGFKENVQNSEQGSAGKIGQESNPILAHCVPKYTPGMQFWENSVLDQGETISSGGSKEETTAICSLGNFVCVSHMELDRPLVNSDWDDLENWECNWQNAEHQGEIKETLPTLLEGLNERCSALGPCGVYVNIEKKVGNNNISIYRTKIDEDGDVHEDFSLEGYSLSEEYFGSLGEDAGIVVPGSIASLTAAVIGIFTGYASNNAAGQASTSISEESEREEIENRQNLQFLSEIGSLASLGASFAGSSAGYTLVFTELTAPQLKNLVPVAKELGSAIIQETGVLVVRDLSQEGVSSLVSVSNPVQVKAENIFVDSGSAGAEGSFGKATATVIAASVAGYFIGKAIAESAGMSPGETEAFVGMMTSLGAGVGTLIAYNLGYIASGPLAVFGIGIAVFNFIKSIFDGKDHRYYTMQFTCDIWEPPKVGSCDLCNDDVRPCSEYRCKSLGQNCEYFNDNGEPGFCATGNDIWAATISPWDEALTEGNKYAIVQDNGFVIEDENEVEVEPWKPLAFGIITDKQTTCKLDYDHGKDYDEMQFNFVTEIDFDTGKVDGRHHRIVLSSHINKSASSSLSPSMEEGENNYYVKCKNFAGLINEADFVVQLEVGDGPDLTAPLITRFEPVNGAYLLEGTNSTELRVYINEPAECRYSQEYDYNHYDELPNALSCLTNPSMGYLGEWTCGVTLENLTTGANEFYFRCKDQPGLNESGLFGRNENTRSETYSLNVCDTGLEINSLVPSGKIVGDGSEPIELSLQTSGCIGSSVCSYSFDSLRYIDFLETGGTEHKQTFTGLSSGDYNVAVQCVDPAGNRAEDVASFEIEIDETIPRVVRITNDDGLIKLQTNEPAECILTTDSSVGCGLEFEESVGVTNFEHSINSELGKTYYVKCRDENGNSPLSCSAIVQGVSV